MAAFFRLVWRRATTSQLPGPPSPLAPRPVLVIFSALRRITGSSTCRTWAQWIRHIQPMLTMDAAERSAQFAERIERHRGIVLKIAASYGRDAHQRADLAQEIAAQAWRSLPQRQPLAAALGARPAPSAARGVRRAQRDRRQPAPCAGCARRGRAFRRLSPTPPPASTRVLRPLSAPRSPYPVIFRTPWRITLSTARRTRAQ